MEVGVKDAGTNIKLRFVFNGVNFYTPFLQKDAAKIIRCGTPLLRGIKQSYSDLKKLIPKIPKESSINVGMKFLDIHMKAAYDLVVNMSMNAGTSFVSENYTQSILATDPLLPARIHRRRCDKRAAANPTGEESLQGSQCKKKKLVERQGIPALTKIAVDAITASGVLIASPPLVLLHLRCRFLLHLRSLPRPLRYLRLPLRLPALPLRYLRLPLRLPALPLRYLAQRLRELSRLLLQIADRTSVTAELNSHSFTRLHSTKARCMPVTPSNAVDIGGKHTASRGARSSPRMPVLFGSITGHCIVACF